MNHTMNNVFLILLTIGLAFACKSSKNATSQTGSYKSIAQESLEGKLKFTENSSGKYVLCSTLPQGTVPSSTRFMVIEIETGEVLIPPSSANGSINWHNETVIAIQETTEAPPRDKTSPSSVPTRYIDVLTNEDISKKL